jgi:hypothetical protein
VTTFLVFPEINKILLLCLFNFSFFIPSFHMMNAFYISLLTMKSSIAFGTVYQGTADGAESVNYGSVPIPGSGYYGPVAMASSSGQVPAVRLRRSGPAVRFPWYSSGSPVLKMGIDVPSQKW